MIFANRGIPTFYSGDYFSTCAKLLCGSHIKKTLITQIIRFVMQGLVIGITGDAI